MNQPTYLIRLRAVDHPNDAPRRLARLLKFAGRSCGLRCVEVSELRDDSETSERTDATSPIAPRGCNGETRDAGAVGVRTVGSASVRVARGAKCEGR